MQYIHQLGGLSKIYDEQKRALDNEEVLQLVKEKAKVVLYENLINYKDIQELLHPHGAVFLLYQIKPSFGHWVAIIKRGNNEIEFFDPLGYMIDEQLLWTKPASLRRQLNMNYPYLTKLLFEAPRNYSIIYNEHKFQKNKKGINTCGAWSALRIAYKHLSLEEFIKDFNIKDESGINDQLVTLWRLVKH